MATLSFHELYEQYGPPVLRFLLSLSGDVDFAEELLQDTFYHAIRYADRFEGRCSVYAWLCQIGKNLWLRESKKRNRRQTLELGTLLQENADASIEDAYIEKDEYVRVRLAIHHLKKPYKDVLILHVYGGLKLIEIAKLYDKTESWARVTYYRAKEQVIKEVLG